MTSKDEKLKPNISSTAFWDVDFENIDFQNSSTYVMCQVFNYGLYNDIIETLKFYGLERIKSEILKASYLKKEALSFLCLILDLNKADFKNFERWSRFNSNWGH